MTMINVCVDRDRNRRAAAVRLYSDAGYRFEILKWPLWESYRTKVFRVGEIVVSGSGAASPIRSFINSVRRSGLADFDSVVEAIERRELPGRALRLWLLTRLRTELVIAGYSKRRRQPAAVTLSTRRWQPDEIQGFMLQPADAEDIERWQSVGNRLSREAQIADFESRRHKLYRYGLGKMKGAAGYLEETIITASGISTEIVRDWR